MVVSERKTKDERREDILDAAMTVFASDGLQGASTDEIARVAGISQPYVFRLFGTKKELFTAVVARCFRRTLEVFQQAAEGKRGEEALNAIGEAYGQLLAGDDTYLRGQMQAYAACGDPDIRAVVRNGFGDLVAYAERVSGLPPEAISGFFAKGMLMNVIASMYLDSLDTPTEQWAQRLIDGCKPDGN
jgi:AcrR family transcriptional regulator